MWLGSLADRTKRNAGVCSQPMAAHTQEGAKGGHSMGLGVRQQERGRGGCPTEASKDWEQKGLNKIQMEKGKQNQGAVWKKQARTTGETSFEIQMINCGGWRGKEEPANFDGKMET